MLEVVDLDRSLSGDQYHEVFPTLAAQLGHLQREARRMGVPVILVFEGWDAAGKGTVINRLGQALDPRGFRVHPSRSPNRTERLHAWMWRFWADVPAAGDISILDQSWYGRVLHERMEHRLPKRQWQKAYQDILEFEQQLAEAGTVIVKFWLHISKEEQKKRFERLENDAATAWKVGKDERKRHKKYSRWLEVVEEMLERTGTACAPWTVVEATDDRYTRVKVFETVIEAIRREIDRRQAVLPASAPSLRLVGSPLAVRTVLDRVDLTVSLSREEYDAELPQLQDQLFELEHQLYRARTPAVIVYQGWDAAGKGGNIKRLTRGLDPRGYEVVPIAAPTEEEKAYHYLWRFWRHVPQAGHIAIFDRSWYGRVLEERVEGFCSEMEWQRAYREINDFERQLADFGTTIIKFWLHIDQDEQLRRFRARQDSPEKQWKITEEDWRNRAKWDQYEAAVEEMVERTSTTYAPWTILEANCKIYARIKALRTVAEVWQKALDAD